MNARQLLVSGRVLRSALHSTVTRKASKAPSSRFADGGPRSTMNDLPIPEGDWQENYSRKNMKNTAILILGIGTFLTSLFMHFTDENVYWNYKVPDYDRCN